MLLIITQATTGKELAAQQLPSIQTTPSSPQTGLQPSQAVPQCLQTMAHSSIPGDNTPIPSFSQFSMPPNVYPLPLLNSTPQPSLQNAVPSLATAHAASLGLLNPLNDDKLGLILPMLVRMEHKIDQLLAMIGSTPGPGMGNHLNVAMMGNRSVSAAGMHKNTTTGGQSSATTAQAQPSTKPRTQANARMAVAELFDSPEETEDHESDSEASADNTFNATKSLPGITSRQRIQLEMAKITEKTLPDDLNFPISREDLITLQARSTSTMNFAVRLLRELFTRDELIGRNISGVRGKERVDPTRIEIIKEIVFKIYRTSPSDKELLWRYCRKAMDSFLRKMQRPIEVVKDQYDPPSFATNDKSSS